MLNGGKKTLRKVRMHYVLQRERKRKGREAFKERGGGGGRRTFICLLQYSFSYIVRVPVIDNRINEKTGSRTRCKSEVAEQITWQDLDA